MISRLQQVFAGLLIALGVLWSLQGAGLIHLKPILCVADCTELQGASVRWLAAGIAAIGIGGGLWYLGRRRARNARTVFK